MMKKGVASLLVLTLLLGACTEDELIKEQPGPETETPGGDETPDEKPDPKPEIAIAFPGAEGGGTDATGGRGGKVYVVNTLEDNSLPGSFRHAIEQKGPRIIVFSVSGTIHLNKILKINSGDLTIAGQSAPGDGICIAGQPFTVSSDNVIIRYMRFRLGYSENISSDGADAVEGRGRNNVIIDHCSVSWSTDECASFYDNSNFTMQWCIISESLRLSGHSKGPHGYGGLWGGNNASYHHNLIAHHDGRTPRFRSFNEAKETDFRNNVIYNWSNTGCYGGDDLYINIVNNYYKPGPATDKSSILNRIIHYNAFRDGGIVRLGKLFVEGNYFPTNSAVSADNWTGGVTFESGVVAADVRSNDPIAVSDVKTDDPIVAYSKVLDYAGCSFRRDEVDKRIVRETRNGTTTFKGLNPNNGTSEFGSVGYPKPGIIDDQNDTRPADASADWTPWPVLASLEAPLDTDGDGMPDEWEIKMGLDPDKYDANGNDLSTGYDNIEVYLNSLVEHITEQQ